MNERQSYREKPRDASLWMKSADVRELLWEIYEDLRDERLLRAADATWRRPREPVARQRRTTVTAEIVREVKRRRAENPHDPKQYIDIANALNIGVGRVSEIMKGQRTEDNPSGAGILNKGKGKPKHAD